MKLFTVDTKKCTRCNKCVVVCPQGVIEASKEACPTPTVDSFKLCINCGYCVDICDVKAFHHKVRKASTSTRAANKRYAALMKQRRTEDEERL